MLSDQVNDCLALLLYLMGEFEGQDVRVPDLLTEQHLAPIPDCTFPGVLNLSREVKLSLCYLGKGQ